MKKSLLPVLLLMGLLVVGSPRVVAEAPRSYSYSDLMEIGRLENILPSVIESRLTKDEILFLLSFHRSVLAENQNGRHWDATAHIADLNRYAFVAERLHRTSGRFSPALVRRIYETRGLTLMHLSNAEVSRLEGMDAAELIRIVKGRR